MVSLPFYAPWWSSGIMPVLQAHAYSSIPATSVSKMRSSEPVIVFRHYLSWNSCLKSKKGRKIKLTHCRGIKCVLKVTPPLRIEPITLGPRLTRLSVQLWRKIMIEVFVQCSVSSLLMTITSIFRTQNRYFTINTAWRCKKLFKSIQNLINLEKNDRANFMGIVSW